MATPNLDEIVTTTLRNRSGTLADNVSNNNALLRRLKERGNHEITNGGRTLTKELDYAENSTFQWYAGYETFDISPSEVFSAAEFDWKQAAVTVSESGVNLRKNSGKEAQIKLLNARIKNAERTMANQISTAIYSDGTGSGGKQIGGLQLLIADDPTSGTVGGIDRSSFSFWRNQTVDASDEGAATSASNILAYMNELWIECLRGSDRPDLIVADGNYFNHFWSSMQAIQRITSSDSAKSGYMSVEYCGPSGSAPVMLDQSAPANHMYFLNTDYLFFEVHPDANFAPLEKQRPVNQDAVSVPLIFMGNMTASNLSLQGVIKE